MCIDGANEVREDELMSDAMSHVHAEVGQK